MLIFGGILIDFSRNNRMMLEGSRLKAKELLEEGLYNKKMDLTRSSKKKNDLFFFFFFLKGLWKPLLPLLRLKGKPSKLRSDWQRNQEAPLMAS